MFDSNLHVPFTDSQPQCLQNAEEYTEGEHANISCEATFRGRWGPVMEWSNTDQEREETSGDRAIWAFQIDPVTSHHNGVSFTCTARYKAPPNPEEGEATNAPTIDSVENCTVTLVVLRKYQLNNVWNAKDETLHIPWKTVA